MESTTAAVTIEADVRLDLGHTDLVGSLVFDGEELTLITPSGTARCLGRRGYARTPGDVFQAAEARVLIEELGLNRALPAALVATGHFLETNRHKDLSFWGADVVELLVIVPGQATSTPE